MNSEIERLNKKINRYRREKAVGRALFALLGVLLLLCIFTLIRVDAVAETVELQGSSLSEQINAVELAVKGIMPPIVADEEPEDETSYLGEFKLTAYCPCEKCCGIYSAPHGEAKTATGTLATANRTIAVDPSVIPYGTHVLIEGLGEYVAEDCGGAVKGNHIDVYFPNHDEAVAFGMQFADVYVLEVKE